MYVKLYSSRPVRLACAMENKENARPYIIREDDRTPTGMGSDGVHFRDDHNDNNDRLAAKIARKESLNIKLALRPDRQELINRSVEFA